MVRESNPPLSPALSMTNHLQLVSFSITQSSSAELLAVIPVKLISRAGRLLPEEEFCWAAAWFRPIKRAAMNRAKEILKVVEYKVFMWYGFMLLLLLF